MWSTHAQKQEVPGNLWNTLDKSVEFPASVSTDPLIAARRAMKLGPGPTGEKI